MPSEAERQTKHDWFSEDCYHTVSRPFGYCGLNKYTCRKCGKVYECAMIAPETGCKRESHAK